VGKKAEIRQKRPGSDAAAGKRGHTGPVRRDEKICHPQPMLAAE